MSDHETWLNDQDKTAQWPTTPPDGSGSSQSEHTKPLDVASGNEGTAPTWAPQPAPGDAPIWRRPTPPRLAAPRGPRQPAVRLLLGQPSFDQPGADQTAAQAPYGPPVYGQPAYGQPPTGSRLMGNRIMGSPLTGSRLMASPLTASPLMASPLTASLPTGSLLMASLLTGSRLMGSLLMGSRLMASPLMDSNRPMAHPKDRHAVPEGFVQRQPSWSLRPLRWRAPALAASCPPRASQLIRPRGRPRPRAGPGAAVTPEVASLSAAAPGATPASCPSRSATADPGSSGSGSSGSGSSGSGSSEGAGGPSDVAAIASKVAPAVVDVNVTFNYQDAQGAGTGIVLTSNGLVLTNNHVVDGATKVSVTDVGNGKTYPATVLGYDKTHDVALIKLQGASNLQTAKLASREHR